MWWRVAVGEEDGEIESRRDVQVYIPGHRGDFNKVLGKIVVEELILEPRVHNILAVAQVVLLATRDTNGVMESDSSSKFKS